MNLSVERFPKGNVGPTPVRWLPGGVLPTGKDAPWRYEQKSLEDRQAALPIDRRPHPGRFLNGSPEDTSRPPRP